MLHMGKYLGLRGQKICQTISLCISALLNALSIISINLGHITERNSGPMRFYTIFNLITTYPGNEYILNF